MMKVLTMTLLSLTVLLSACDKKPAPAPELSLSETEQLEPQQNSETMLVEGLSSLDERLRTVTGDINQLRESVVKEVSEQYETSKTEMSEQLKSLSQRLDNIKTAPDQTKQLEKLDQTLSALDARVKALENKPNKLNRPDKPAPAAKTPVKPTVNTKTDTPAEDPPPQKDKATVSNIPPFTVIGTELRGEQTFLSVMPKHQSSTQSVQFLTVGQSIGGWQLTRLTGKEAVFQTGDKHETITLP